MTDRTARRPLFSVVTPVRDGERYLADAIRSVREQTLEDWEYVVVDGGSSDRSREIAQDLAAGDVRIEVVSEPDRGMYDAIFKGLARGSAPICTWLNADDRLMPWAFDVVARYHRLSGADWITGLAAQMDRDGLVHTIENGRWYPRRLIRQGLFHSRALGFMQQEGTFVSRRWLERLEPDVVERIRATTQAGDFLLWTELAKFGGVHPIPTVLGAFRVHEHNMTRDQTRYYEEMAALGFRVPPRFVAIAMKAVLAPLTFAAQRRRLRQWRRFALRLPPPDR